MLKKVENAGVWAKQDNNAMHPKCYNNKLFLTFSSFKIYASIKWVPEIINHKASHQTIYLVPGIEKKIHFTLS